MELEVKAIANLLSHQITGLATSGRRNYFKSMSNQQSSAVVEVKLLYLASAEERATVHCFFAVHIMGLALIQTQKPIVDFLSNTSPT